MKSTKEDYTIRKRVALDSGPREDLLIFLSLNTIVLHYVFVSRSKNCTSKVVTPDNKRTMAENTASWRKQLKNWTRMTISSLNFLSTNLLFLHLTILQLLQYLIISTSASSEATILNLSYSWS